MLQKALFRYCCDWIVQEPTRKNECWILHLGAWHKQLQKIWMWFWISLSMEAGLGCLHLYDSWWGDGLEEESFSGLERLWLCMSGVSGRGLEPSMSMRTLMDHPDHPGPQPFPGLQLCSSQETVLPVQWLTLLLEFWVTNLISYLLNALI